MSNFVFVIISIIWLIIAVLDYSEFCYFWQLKEYRRDKFLDFLREKQGGDFLKSYLVFGRLLIFLSVVSFWLWGKEFSADIFVLLLILECIRCVVKCLRRSVRRPKATVKAFLIILASIGIEIIAWKMFKNVSLVVFLFTLRFAVISIVVALFFLPTKLFKKIYVARATRKIKKYEKLRVIGVTGSYGKTTVKNFMAQILSVNLKVIATPKNINTEIGIARFILKTDFSQTDIFIVEMGAYEKGEIKLVCEMMRPEIGVLTAINEQHISLFGNIQNIQAAKYELLFSLPKNGLAIVNSDNKYCREFINKLNCNVKTFGTQKKYTPSCFLEKITANDDQAINFTCTLGSEIFEINAPVIGGHNTMNIAPCVIVADYLGIAKEKIIEQAKNLKMPEGTLRTYAYGKSIAIDDSYNANPDGFLAALQVLENYPSEFKKIVITRGMLELGGKSSELHQKIGQRISEVAGEMVIISRDNEKDLRIGAGNMKIKSIYDFNELMNYIKKLKEDENIILLENRITENVIRELIGK